MRVRRVVTTRAGGRSTGPFARFNLSAGVGDDPLAVAANRRRLADKLGVRGVVFLGQVHGTQVAFTPGGGECAGPSPVDPRKQGLKRSVLVEGYGIPLGRVLAGANRHDSPLLGPTLDRLDDLGPLPDDITVHLDAGYDSRKTRDELAGRGMTGEIAHKGDKAPIQAGQRWHVERTNAWHNGFNRLQRCYERRENVIDAFFDLADAIITVRSLIRQAWTTCRWDSRPSRRPWP